MNNRTMFTPPPSPAERQSAQSTRAPTLAAGAAPIKPRYFLDTKGVIRATPDTVKDALRRRGMTQTDIAKELGVRNTVVWANLHGHVRSARIEAELSKVLGMPFIFDPRRENSGAQALRRLEEELQRFGRTLGDWATENGFTRDDIGRLRTGISRATCGKAKALALALGLPVGKKRRKSFGEGAV